MWCFTLLSEVLASSLYSMKTLCRLEKPGMYSARARAGDLLASTKSASAIDIHPAQAAAPLSS